MPHELERFHQLLVSYARDHGDAIAVQDSTERFTFRQLLAEVGLRIQDLRTRSPGTLVLALDNGPQLLFWDLAALFTQRPCVVVPPFFSVAQFSHCIAQSGPSHVLCGSQWCAPLAELGFAQQDGFWVREADATAALPPGTAKITYTSGSTGKPKGVCLSAEALLRVARELEVASRPSEPQRYLVVLPLGVLLENLGVYAALMAGASVLLYPQAQLGMGGPARSISSACWGQSP